MNYFHAARQTGRTERMLQEAYRLAREGRAVYIVASDDRHRENLRTRIARDLAGKDLGIKVETPCSIPLRCEDDWAEPFPIGSHTNCRLLIDHYAVECRFRAILDLAHRWDEQPKGKL